jgi:hypothetical protein
MKKGRTCETRIFLYTKASTKPTKIGGVKFNLYYRQKFNPLL